ncbi:uncharacterized protein LOC110969531 isoform X2 [Acanthochromis polyacanthus]|uniref:uncharacterized protein LOC110969531 isoform X2 n=1 Tax=Acanthochromis polyacanthus TaxID=80966 RepID=UPI0022349DC4|nr:uncharacterized protein LOC110969531 isoform X2 [Acanthochromis polyacanthus]
MRFTSDFTENKPKVAYNKRTWQQNAYRSWNGLLYPSAYSMHPVPAWFWFWLLMNSPSLAQTPIPAKLGQTAILPCKAPNNKTIKGVEWKRPDQNQGYVLLYRDGKFLSEFQHPSCENRVDLQDKEMKDGDVSLVLKDVTMEDRGRYECRVLQKGENKPASIIDLEVHPSGHQDGITGDGGKKDGTTGDGGNNNGIILGPLVVLLLPFVLVIGCILMCRKKPKVYKQLKRISRKLMGQDSTPPVTPGDQGPEQLTDLMLPAEQT